MEPSTWPSTSSGLIAVPPSWATQTRSMQISPVAESTSSSTTEAVKEYAGVGPPRRLVEGHALRRVVADEDPAVPRLQAGRRDLELLRHRVEELAAELLGRLLRRVAGHQRHPRGVGAEVHRREVGV